MDIVEINAFAVAHDIQNDYEETIIITKQAHEVIKEDLRKEKLYISGLYGKHSKTECTISFYECKEKELSEYNWKKGCKSDTNDDLYKLIDQIFNKHNLSLEDEIEKVDKYLDSLNSFVDLRIDVRKSDVNEVKKFCEERGFHIC